MIDAYVQSLDVKKLGYQVFINKVGRPAYNPKEMIGLYLYSYMSKVMSSRMIERQTYINLQIMWLLNGTHPDHSTIAAFRSKNVKSLSKKIAHIDEQISEYFSSLDKNNRANDGLQTLESRKTSYQDMLEQLNNSDETQISTTNPDSRLMVNKKGGLDVAYNIQATIDSKNVLVIDQYVTKNKDKYHRRQKLSEHIFGSIKRQLGFPQLHVRTKPKVEGGVSLLFLGYNLKRFCAL